MTSRQSFVSVFLCPDLPYSQVYVEKNDRLKTDTFLLYDGKLETVPSVPAGAKFIGHYVKVRDRVILETKLDGNIKITEMDPGVLWTLEAITGEYAIANYFYVCKRVPFGFYKGNKEVEQAELDHFKPWQSKIDEKSSFSYDQTAEYLYGAPSKSKKKKI